jgi:2-polyprenyl-3-methyl-5-hydroxy-6-metoxy-1,4-benzoquinol methylase
MTINYKCQLCKYDLLTENIRFKSLLQVTSDARIWRHNGKIACCQNCGFTQKLIDDNYLQEIGEIYSEYNIYYQGEGHEQKVFIGQEAFPRSKFLASHFLPFACNPSITIKPKWLDLGCGRGHFLKTIAELKKDWELYGADLGESNREHIESIDGVASYFANSIDGVSDSYDMISMIHVLEHVVEPYDFLLKVQKKINDEGLLFIAVPGWMSNPFDLLVADHCLHFSTQHLTLMLEMAGFELVSISDEVLPKEILVVAKKVKNFDVKKTEFTLDPNANTMELIKFFNESIDWLFGEIQKGLALLTNENIGVFGTALAATWLDASCEKRFNFFVEEDFSRVNTFFLDRQVYLPLNIPPGSKVFVPLSPKIAKKVCDRLNQLEVETYFF